MKSTNTKWNGQSIGPRLGYLFFIIMARFFGLLPAYFFLIFVTMRYALGEKKARTAIRHYYERLGRPASLYAVYRHYLAFGMTIVDRFAFLQLSKTPFKYTCINEETIVRTVEEGNGLIFLGSHIGNWELGSNLLNDRIKAPINLVMLEAEKEKLQETMQEMLKKRRVNIIPITGMGTDTAIPVVNALRRGEIVAMMGDRLLDRNGERIDFLGKPALFSKGPFVYAALTGAPVIPFVTVKTGLKHYTFKAWEPIRLRFTDRAGRDRAILDAMKKYVAILEEVVRQHPRQWFNFFEYWD